MRFRFSEAGLPLCPRYAGEWDAILCWVSVDRYPAMGRCGHLCTLWCTDIWLAHEVC